MSNSYRTINVVKGVVKKNISIFNFRILFFRSCQFGIRSKQRKTSTSSNLVDFQQAKKFQVKRIW